jgi:GntR family transcriptional regulator
MFQLDAKSHKSIYEQVIDNIKELIMTNVLPEDSKLPSVRELSKDLTVNPNTVQKAFKELEREGYIYTVSGKGTFVSGKDGIKLNPAMVAEIQSDIMASYRELLYLGLSEKDARALAIKAIDKAGYGKEQAL